MKNEKKVNEDKNMETFFGYTFAPDLEHLIQ